MFNECVWRAIGKDEFGMSEFWEKGIAGINGKYFFLSGTTKNGWEAIKNAQKRFSQIYGKYIKQNFW